MTNTPIISVRMNPCAAYIAACTGREKLHAAFVFAHSEPPFGSKSELTVEELYTLDSVLSDEDPEHKTDVDAWRRVFEELRKERLRHHVGRPIEISLDGYGVLTEALEIAMERLGIKDEEVALGMILKTYLGRND